MDSTGEFNKESTLHSSCKKGKLQDLSATIFLKNLLTENRPLQGFDRYGDAMNGGRFRGISLSVPQTQKTEGSQKGGSGGIINLPNTDVGPKRGDRLGHVSAHICKCKSRNVNFLAKTGHFKVVGADSFQCTHEVFFSAHFLRKIYP